MGSGASFQGPPSEELCAELSEAWVGKLAAIEGLKSATGAELNGRVGEVRRVDPKTCRLCVSFDPRHPERRWKKLLSANCRPTGLQVLDGECSFCLERGEFALVRPCLCRGENVGVHLACLAEAYERLNSEHVTYPTCPTCKENYDARLAVMLLEFEYEKLNLVCSLGRKALIFGLTSAKSLNGQVVTLMKQDEAAGRWLVEVNGEMKAVKEDNLIIQGTEGSRATNLLRALGVAYSSMNLQSAAARVIEKVIAVEEMTSGTDNPELSVPLTNLGTIYLQQEEIAKAMAALDRAFALQADDPAPAVLTNLGRVHKAKGDFAQAEEFFSLALSKMGDDRIVPVLFELGETQFALQKIEDSKRTMERVLDIQERTFGKNHASLIPTLRGLAEAYFEEDNFRDAAQVLERTVDIIELDCGPHLSMEPIFQRLVAIYTSTKDDEHLERVKERIASLLANNT